MVCTPTGQFTLFDLCLLTVVTLPLELLLKTKNALQYVVVVPQSYGYNLEM
jgi:hypothetical protein